MAIACRADKHNYLMQQIKHTTHQFLNSQT